MSRSARRPGAALAVAVLTAPLLGACGAGTSGTVHSPTSTPATGIGSTSPAPISSPAGFRGTASLSSGEEIADKCSDLSITLYAFSPSADTLTQLTTLDLTQVLSNWSSPSVLSGGTVSTGGTVNCNRAGFSGDFTKLLFSGIPPGQTQLHIGYIDLTNGSVHDLTAPRQGSGFQATLLNEGDPAFLGPGDGSITFGSDQIEFTDTAGNESVTSLADPAHTSPLTAPQSRHPELSVNGQTGTPTAVGGFTPATDGTPASPYNPSFTLKAQQGPDGTGGPPYVVSFPSSGGAVRVPCNPPQSSDRSQSLGWADDSRLVIESGQDFADAVFVATVDPHTLKIQCSANLLPSNNRQPSYLTLSLDKSAVLFSANDGTSYRLPLIGGDPLPTSPQMPLPEGVDVWTK